MNTTPTPTNLQEILQAGMRAPSADNRHTLRFERFGNTLRVISTDAATWPALPHRRMLAGLAYGAVLENMRLRSAQLGYALEERWLPEAAREDLIAELHWTPSATPADPLADMIDRRHTNRRFYRREEVPATALACLRSAAEEVEGTRLVWLDAAPQRRLALQAIRMAETERFRRRELHHELFGAIRFELGWLATAEEGLPPAALEVEPAMRLPFSLLRSWPVMRAATWLGMHHGLGLRAGYLPCALSPHIGLLLRSNAGVVEATRSFMQTGRALERMWLTAAAKNLAVQPMAAATALSLQAPGNGWVSNATQTKLRGLLHALSIGTDEHVPCLMFRLGLASETTVVTSRTPPHLDAC